MSNFHFWILRSLNFIETAYELFDKPSYNGKIKFTLFTRHMHLSTAAAVVQSEERSESSKYPLVMDFLTPFFPSYLYLLPTCTVPESHKHLTATCKSTYEYICPQSLLNSSKYIWKYAELIPSCKITVFVLSWIISNPIHKLPVFKTHNILFSLSLGSEHYLPLL